MGYKLPLPANLTVVANMFTKMVLLISLMVSCVVFAPITIVAAVRPQNSMSVLWLGNSFIFVNNLDRQFSKIAHSRGITVTSDRITHGSHMEHLQMPLPRFGLMKMGLRMIKQTIFTRGAFLHLDPNSLTLSISPV